MNIKRFNQSTSLLETKGDQGEIAYAIDEDCYYLYNEGWQPVEATMEGSNIVLGLYDLNAQILAQLPPITDFDEKCKLIEEFIHNTNNNYYMMYGKNISYFTVFCRKNFNGEFTTVGDAVITCLENVGLVKSIDLTESKDAIEIWVTTPEDVTTCLYLFPYDMGLVTVKE